MTIRSGLLVAILAAFVVTGTGCADSKQKAEHDSLLNQNKELTEQLQAEKAAHAASDSRASAMSTQLTAAPPESSVPGMTGGSIVDLSGPGRAPARGTTPTHSTPVPTKLAAPSKITLPGAIYFDSGKTTLSAASTKTLDTIAATLKKSHAGDKIVIEGFSDSTPVKNPALKSNEALSEARATSVMKYLAKKGIPSKDMSVKAMGTADPKSTKDQNLNRRVEVVVMK